MASAISSTFLSGCQSWKNQFFRSNSHSHALQGKKPHLSSTLTAGSNGLTKTGQLPHSPSKALSARNSPEATGPLKTSATRQRSSAFTSEIEDSSVKAAGVRRKHRQSLGSRTLTGVRAAAAVTMPILEETSDDIIEGAVRARLGDLQIELLGLEESDDVREAQAFLEHAWQLPSTSDGERSSGLSSCDVPTTTQQSSRKSSNQSRVRRRRLAIVLQVLGGESREAIYSLEQADVPSSKTLQGEDVLVKFPETPEPLEPGSPRLVAQQKRRRRSLDAASTVLRQGSLNIGNAAASSRRVLVRSSRKGRMSLESRVEGKGGVALPRSSSVFAKSEAESHGLAISEREVDEMLRGYGWKGDFNLEWGKYAPMLTLEEEKRILLLLEEGKEFREAQSALKDRLSHEPSATDLAIATRLPVGDANRLSQVYRAAQNKLVMHNLGIVVSLANMYKTLGFGVDFESLCQRGVRGLYQAAEKFSLNRKCRFSTFASLCVRTVITREIAASMHVRAPTYCSYKFLLLRRLEREMEEKLQRKPTEAELARATKMGVSQLRLLRRLFLLKPFLLHHPAKESGLDMGDILADRSQGVGGAVVPDAEERAVGDVEWDSLRYALDDVIDSLRPNESVVIRQRFGLDGGGVRSLTEVARNLAVSRQMIGKYEARALAKLQLEERMELFKTQLEAYP